ncbi:hypothetical protein MJL48_34860, partial [Salmonella enterica subsp. enterica serovar Kentucky]|nr:hypothetical protein [Salmonella enterica subsp. enterica serovar Kentucky]
PSVTAMRVIASVNDGFARELKLPPHIRSLGLITADSDDVTYIGSAGDIHFTITIKAATCELENDSIDVNMETVVLQRPVKVG